MWAILSFVLFYQENITYGFKQFLKESQIKYKKLEVQKKSHTPPKIIPLG